MLAALPWSKKRGGDEAFEIPISRGLRRSWRLHRQISLDYYTIPSATQARLIAPKVNPKKWGRFDHHAMGKDLNLSNLQATLTKVGNITARTADMLLKARSENIPPDIEAMIRMSTDAVALLGYVSFEIAQRRRHVIRPNLNKDYATLCASHVLITSMLFGDELQAQINHIRASNKISDTTGSSTFAGKRQYIKPETSSRQWRPFFSKTPPGNQSQTYRKPAQHNRTKLNTIQVSEFEGILPSLLEYFWCKAQMFTAGSIAAYSHIW